MRYSTNYDIGDRKRGQGINEDSVSLVVFEEGHRDGYRGQRHGEAASDDEGETTDEDSVRPAEKSATAGQSERYSQTDVYRESDVTADSASEAGNEADSDGQGVTDSHSETGEQSEDDEQSDTGQLRDDEQTSQDDSDPADEGEQAAADAEHESATDATAEEEAGSADGMPMNRSAAVFVVADGAGGHDAGDVASYITTTVVAEQLAPIAIRANRSRPEAFDVAIDRAARPDPLGEAEIEIAVAEAITEAHREIIRYADETGTQSYTTVVAGVYADGKLHYGWVGDSRVYVVNDVRETISQLTKDHAVVQDWEDSGEIDPVEAHVHPNGNEITRALGGSGYEDPAQATVEVDTRTVRLYAEDTVVATSDGLIDAQTDAPRLYEEYVDSDRSETVAERVLDQVVTDDEIRDVVLDATSLDDASREFVTLANERGGKDNISLLLFGDTALPDTPKSGGMPVRDIDPDGDISDRDTVIMADDLTE